MCFTPRAQTGYSGSEETSKWLNGSHPSPRRTCWRGFRVSWWRDEGGARKWTPPTRSDQNRIPRTLERITRTQSTPSLNRSSQAPRPKRPKRPSLPVMTPWGSCSPTVPAVPSRATLQNVQIKTKTMNFNFIRETVKSGCVGLYVRNESSLYVWLRWGYIWILCTVSQKWLAKKCHQALGRGLFSYEATQKH